MKKALLIVLSVIIACLAATTLTACYIGNGGNSEHTHNYVWVDNGDGTHKQHCNVNGCKKPDVNVGNHAFGANGKCVCGAEKPAEHKHSYTEEVIESKYLKTAETCKAKAVYYYSCECGEKGTETFEYGNPLGHSFTKYVSDNNATCFQNGTKTASCDRCGEKDTVTVEGTKVSHKYENNVCIYCGHIKASEGLDYTLRTNNSCNYYEVSGIGSCFDTKISIPETYNNLPIKSIGRRAFAGCTEITSITIPDSVTSIYYAAFSDCSGLISMTMGNGVTFIGDSVFSYCSSLTTIILPDNVTSIGKFAFGFCKRLTSISIPNSLMSIGTDAFSACSSLTYNEYDNAYYLGNETNPYIVLLHAKNVSSCEINDKTKFIYDYAFASCSSLTRITIPDNVVNIGNGAFNECKKLADIKIGNSVTSIGGYAFNKCANLTSITIPNGVTYIGVGAFVYCTNLTSITIPDSVISVGNYAFGGCPIATASMPICAVSSIPKSSLKYVTITSGESIGDYAFENCTNLTRITLPNSVMSIGSGVFNGCSKLKYTEIGDGYYLGNSSNQYLILVKIKDKKIANYAINDKTKFIYDYAFSGCTNLTRIEIPNSVTSIGNYAFRYCEGLTSITIPNSVTRIGSGAFLECNSLTYNEYDNACYLGNDDNPYLLLVKAKNKDIVNCEINDKTQFIYSEAFRDCSSLTSITIPNNVVSIGEYAFCNCSGLTNVTIGNRVTSIGHRAFANCSSLTGITIPNSVTSLGIEVFSLCGNLVYNEYENAYYLGNEINPYIILRKVKSSDITSCMIGAETKFIYTCAFASCSSLKEVFYKGTASEWENIVIDSDNSYLTDAKRYYYSESRPVERGNYWHYVDGEIVVW